MVNKPILSERISCNTFDYILHTSHFDIKNYPLKVGGLLVKDFKEIFYTKKPRFFLSSNQLAYYDQFTCTAGTEKYFLKGFAIDESDRFSFKF